jgi:hypothetical protein
MKPPERMQPLRKEHKPANAAIIGFLFGGIGLGLYFKSVTDFLVPVGFAVATAIAAAVTTSQAGLGVLSGALIAARWGYYRARQSNARLAAATIPVA